MRDNINSVNVELPQSGKEENIPMTCFLVPATETAIITAVKAGLKESTTANSDPTQTKRRLELVQKISWPANLLWGGVVLLALEHLWHNEVVLWSPLPTATAGPGDTAQMLHEVSTVGATTTVLVTIVWGGAVVATSAIRRRFHTGAQAGDNPEIILKEGKNMVLLITVIAAIIAIAVWYAHAPQSQMRAGIPAWMYWGAAIMWFVDAISGYVEDPKGYFAPQPTEIPNNTYLGLSVLTLGGIIWIVTLLATDPRSVVAKTMNALIETRFAKNTTGADQTPAAIPQV